MLLLHLMRLIKTHLLRSVLRRPILIVNGEKELHGFSAIDTVDGVNVETRVGSLDSSRGFSADVDRFNKVILVVGMLVRGDTNLSFS